MGHAIRQAVVVGAGAMGAAIAAHLANAGIPTDLLDIVPRELTPDEHAKGWTLEHPAVRDRLANAGWQRCLGARPAPLFAPDYAERVRLGNLEDHLGRIGEADWIVEAVVERLDVKRAVMARVEATRRPGSIVSTNTSGIPVRRIADGRSDEFRAHFLGTHFFNPPRHLKLLEIIPHPQTRPEVVEFMRDFGARVLGKGVVVGKDTPNFIANRIRSMAGAFALNYALENGYTVAEVDALTGPLVGRPRTASFRLYDLVGIDVAAQVRSQLYAAVPHDPYRGELIRAEASALFDSLLARRWLGHKTGQGFYKRVETSAGRQFWALNPQTMEYEPPSANPFDSVERHEHVQPAGERIRRLCAEDDRAAGFIWATTAFVLQYAAHVAFEVADDILAVDRSIRWGFNWELGPFETWDALGVAESVARMESESVRVAPWVKGMLAAGCASFYREEAGRLHYYDPGRHGHVAAESDPRALSLKALKKGGRRVIAGDVGGELIDLGDGMLCLEFRSTMGALDEGAVGMAFRALEELEKDWVGLVIGGEAADFSAGGDLAALAAVGQRGDWERLDARLRQGQEAAMALRYSAKPVVAAPFHRTEGTGAEIVLAASAVCAAAESYIGLVDAGLGLAPAMGGCKELLRRVVSPVARSSPDTDLYPFLRRVFETIALAKVSASAEEARRWGFLAPTDRIVMNRDHVLHAAKRMALEMAEAVYRPPMPGKEIWAAGASGLAMLQTGAWGMREAGYASAHDARVADRIAYVLCGGRLSRPQWVDVQYILDLEREAFLSLLGEPETIERVQRALAAGSPARGWARSVEG